MSRIQVQLGSPSAVTRTVSFLTASNSSTVNQDYQDVPSSRPQLQVHTGPSRAITGISVSQARIISSLTSNTSPVHQDHQYTLSSRTSQISSSPVTGTGFTKFVSSLTTSNSSTIHRNYPYASSLWKDHLSYANSSSFLESPLTTTCFCLSELVSVPTDLPSSKLTPDDRASLVIRAIECITTHLPIDSEDDQFVREQALDFDSAK